MKSHDPLKPVGIWEVRRTITVPTLAEANGIMKVEKSVAELPGVRKVIANSELHRIELCYDASKTDYQAIAEKLTQTSMPPSASWWNRLKGCWFQFTDANIRNNANAPPPPCCNKPPR